MAILIQYANGVPGVKFALDHPEISIGRALTNDISIDDEFVSKHHAIIQLIKDEVTSEVVCILIDNNSTNHTYVNNVKVAAHQLDENDKIYIGQNEFRFSAEYVSVSDFYTDDAPGLMHAKVMSALPVTGFDPITSRLPNLSDIHSDKYLKEISGTRLLLENIYPTVDITDTKISLKPESDENKRFSRRLSLI